MQLDLRPANIRHPGLIVYPCVDIILFTSQQILYISRLGLQPAGWLWSSAEPAESCTCNLCILSLYEAGKQL